MDDCWQSPPIFVFLNDTEGGREEEVAMGEFSTCREFSEHYQGGELLHIGYQLIIEYLLI